MYVTLLLHDQMVKLIFMTFVIALAHTATAATAITNVINGVIIVVLFQE